MAFPKPYLGLGSSFFTFFCFVRICEVTLNALASWMTLLWCDNSQTVALITQICHIFREYLYMRKLPARLRYS